MSTLDPPHEGSCRCGQVRLTIATAPVMTMACHCRGCQKMTASAYSLNAIVPSEAFSVEQGEPVVGGLHGASRHFFCPYCMSWLFTRPEGMDAFVVVRSVMFDHPSESAPFIETWTTEKLPFATIPTAHSFPTFPSREDFPKLMAEFAIRAGA